jgi:elongation factor G
MGNISIGNRRNIAFCGHSYSGKTTLLDHLLLVSGAASGRPSVDDGTSICDFDAEEKLHHHTIETKVVHCKFGETYMTLLDTPGYPDFVGHTIEAFAAADSAAICVNAHSGIEVNTRLVLREAQRAGIGSMIVLTRLDGENIDLPKLLESLRETFGSACALINVPLGIGPSIHGVSCVFDGSSPSDAVMDPKKLYEEVVERIVEADEATMNRFFEGDIPTGQELKQLVPKALAAHTLIPVFCTAAKNDIGLQDLLDGMVWAAPSPDQLERVAMDESGNEFVISQTADAPLIARVFKNRIDPFVQKLSFIRIYSGSLAKDQMVHVSGSRKDIKFPPILEVQAGQTHPIDRAEAGEIIAVAKVEELHIGTTLGNANLPKIQFPIPMVGQAVSPKGHNDENKLFNALHKLVEEDPTLKIERDSQTSQLVMTGMSEMHLSFIRDKLAHRDRLEIETSDPKIPLRETIQRSGEGSYRHKKQSGGRGQFGEVHMRLYPLPKGTEIEAFLTKDRFPHVKTHHYDADINFLWVDSVVGGTIPGNFMPAVEKGVRERMNKGVIAGYTIQDICVEVHFGKHHPVDSSEAAFKIAGAMAFRNIFRESQPCLLEPIVQLLVTVPESSVGDIYSDMSTRGGRVHGSDPVGGGFFTINCDAPLRSVLHFGRVLSNLTGGQGSFTMDFDRYEIMPGNIQQEFMSAAKIHEEEEALA